MSSALLQVINAMQETVVNVLRFFLQGDAQSPAKRKALVRGRAGLGPRRVTEGGQGSHTKKTQPRVTEEG